jgi:c-di-GMP-binding flagellar brake protein YcgR
MENHQEKRKFKRAIFTSDDKVIGLFTLARRPEKIITGTVLNLSMGGIYFTIDANRAIIPVNGDQMVLMQIKSPKSLSFLVNIDAQIKWVFNPAMLKFIGVGCEFVNIPELSKKQLNNFVDDWHEK